MTQTLTLTRSSDRKTAAAATPNGKGVRVNNAFGLPAGKAFSCPDATALCEKVCYAGRIEKQYKAFFNVVKANLDALIAAGTVEGMTALLSAMISEFVAECEKKNVPAFFRIHHDGDFFSVDYAEAWANVIRAFPNVTFWVYTRSFVTLNVVPILVDLPNLNLLLSVDVYNKQAAKAIVRDYPSVAIATLADTFAEAAEESREIRGTVKPGAACPELTKAIPLISEKGGACFACGLCTVKRESGPIDIRFAVKKR